MELVIYPTGGDYVIRPAPRTRGWMDATPERFAYRCLPLIMANQNGWIVENLHRVVATCGPDTLSVTGRGACSHFGSGILTFNFPFLVQTPPGWDLLVRGPSNYPKDGIYPLEGLVESDKVSETFTMNWKFTRPGIVVFEVGEPLCMLTPIPRTERLERVDREMSPELRDKFLEWSSARSAFIRRTDRRPEEWQKDYYKKAERTKL